MNQQGLIRKRRLITGGGFIDELYRVGRNGLERVKYVTLNGVKTLMPVARTAVHRLVDYGIDQGTDAINSKLSGRGAGGNLLLPKPSKRLAILSEISRQMNGGMIQRL